MTCEKENQGKAGIFTVILFDVIIVPNVVPFSFFFLVAELLPLLFLLQERHDLITGPGEAIYALSVYTW